MDVRLHLSSLFALPGMLRVCLSMYFSFRYVRSLCRSLCRSLWTRFECWGWFGYGEGIKESPFLKRDRVFGVGLYVDRLTNSLLVGGAIWEVAWRGSTGV